MNGSEMGLSLLESIGLELSMLFISRASTCLALERRIPQTTPGTSSNHCESVNGEHNSYELQASCIN